MDATSAEYRKQFVKLLEDGCHQGCDYDEAEGGLLNHCEDCCRKITAQAYELFAIQMIPLEQIEDRDGDRYRWLKNHMSYYKHNETTVTTWQHVTASTAINLDEVIDEHMR